MEYSYEYSDESYGRDVTSDIVHCYCQDHCPFGDDKGICAIKPGGKCFTSVEAAIDEKGVEYPAFSYGCLPADEMALMQCKGSLVPHAESKSIQCCDEVDFCNRNLFPLYKIEETTPNPDVTPDKLPFVMLVSSLSCCFVILGLVITVALVKYKKRRAKEAKIESSECDVEEYGVNNNEANSIRENEMMANLANLMEVTEVEGGDLAKMVQRTIAQQMEMEKSIGKGRYSEVWAARWREERVAVKIFRTAEIQSWYRETEIYQTVLMRHDNILGFIAADVKGSGSFTQMMLITDYHERGSLYDFLQFHQLNPLTLLCMSRSIARGLAHLHTEIFGIHGKPSIAHRDLQSKNILVKNNGECCIGDFGLAVKFHSSFNQIELPKSERIGTRRYMAPEVLDNSINVGNFEAHKMADMYSFGLVLWEMARRCQAENHPAMEYARPFDDLLSDDPSVEDMRELVCVRKFRPQVPEIWNSVDILKIIVKAMQELWHENPAVRLTSLRVKKTLLELQAVDSHCVNVNN